jgi:putative intracellular protease/amidase
VGAIKDDLVNAGLIWEDSPVVVDGNLISSRTPADLPQFCRALIEALERSRVASRGSRVAVKADSPKTRQTVS